MALAFGADVMALECGSEQWMDGSGMWRGSMASWFGSVVYKVSGLDIHGQIAYSTTRATRTNTITRQKNGSTMTNCI